MVFGAIECPPLNPPLKFSYIKYSPASQGPWNVMSMKICSQKAKNARTIQKDISTRLWLQARESHRKALYCKLATLFPCPMEMLASCFLGPWFLIIWNLFVPYVNFCVNTKGDINYFCDFKKHTRIICSFHHQNSFAILNKFCAKCQDRSVIRVKVFKIISSLVKMLFRGNYFETV